MNEEDILAASDREETRIMDGNLMMGLEIASASLGKKIVYSYSTTGGQLSMRIEDV